MPHVPTSLGGLPDIYLIADYTSQNQFEFLNSIEETLISGIRLLQLRAKTLAPIELEKLAVAINTLCQKYHAILMVNADLSLENSFPCQGIHLTSTHLMSLQQLSLTRHYLISAACHNEAELDQAKKIGVDFVTLSPVMPTQSHLNTAFLGWEKFKTLITSFSIPVFALGGMEKDFLQTAKHYGAYGIAGIRGLGQAFATAKY